MNTCRKREESSLGQRETPGPDTVTREVSRNLLGTSGWERAAEVSGVGKKL